MIPLRGTNNAQLGTSLGLGEIYLAWSLARGVPPAKTIVFKAQPVDLRFQQTRPGGYPHWLGLDFVGKGHRADCDQKTVGREDFVWRLSKKQLAPHTTKFVYLPRTARPVHA